MVSASGYQATPIGVILERAGVARGGLYHHFAGKQELFAAVFDQLEDEVLGWLSGAAHFPGGPWATLRAACGLYLSACSSAEVRRVLLRDGPAVLAEAAGGNRRLAALRARLEHALGDAEQARTLAPMLLGAMESAARGMGERRDRHAWEDLNRSLTSLLEGLRLVQQQGMLPALPGLEEEPWQAWSRRGAPTPRS